MAGHAAPALAQPDTEVVYKVSGKYAPETDRGIAWNDPDIGIDWPVKADDVVLSEKDTKHPTLADSPTYFTHTQ